MEQTKQMVEVTAEELELLKQVKAAKAKEEAEKKKAADMAAYKQLVDEAIGLTLTEAQMLNARMADTKSKVMDRFITVIGMKNGIFQGKKTLKENRYTDTFTNSDSTARVTLGYNTNDAYDDTYTAGVDMVKEYIESLASDEKSEQLASMVTTLLQERSKAGQLKAQNVLRLEKMATESGDPKFIEGMRIIRNAYNPEKTKVFIKVERRDEKTNEWKGISLNMTDC